MAVPLKYMYTYYKISYFIFIICLYLCCFALQLALLLVQRAISLMMAILCFSFYKYLTGKTWQARRKGHYL